MSHEGLVKASEELVSYLKSLYGGWEGARQFKGTPDRLVRMYEDFCWPSEKIEEEVEKAFKQFENGYDEMLVVKDISVWTLCPHHLLPCHFNVTIGYLPTGKVLGLSKFARIAVAMGRRPVMQEEYCSELAKKISEGLEPKGVAVYIVGKHGCMNSRGILQSSDVVTSKVQGDFLKEHSTREEFFAICRS